MPKKAKAPAAPPPNPEVAKIAAAAGTGTTRATGQSGWRDNKYGYTAASISCYNCEWYEPYDLARQAPQQPPQAAPANGEPLPQAFQYGWCRGESVPQENVNAAIPGAPEGYFKNSDYNVPPFYSINEPLIRDATEFWCGFWVRAKNQFPWPPIFAPLIPPWQPEPNGPSTEDEPE